MNRLSRNFYWAAFAVLAFVGFIAVDEAKRKSKMEHVKRELLNPDNQWVNGRLDAMSKEAIVDDKVNSSSYQNIREYDSLTTIKLRVYHNFSVIKADMARHFELDNLAKNIEKKDIKNVSILDSLLASHPNNHFDEGNKNLREGFEKEINNGKHEGLLETYKLSVRLLLLQEFANELGYEMQIGSPTFHTPDNERTYEL